MSFYDAYETFNSDRGKYKATTFKTNNGTITFVADERTNADTVYIYSVYVTKNKQRKGLFAQFIHQLYNDKNVREIGILAVGTQCMENCLRKIMFNGYPFMCHGGDFIYAKDLNYCKCHHIVNDNGTIRFVRNKNSL